MINAKKSHGITVFKKSFALMDSCVLRVNGSEIEIKDNVRNLGVILNRTLSWDDHINFTKKIYSGLRTLTTQRALTPQAPRLKLVQSLIIPHFTYCDVLFAHLAYESNVELNVACKKLQLAHNSCIRYIYGLR